MYSLPAEASSGYELRPIDEPAKDILEPSGAFSQSSAEQRGDRWNPLARVLFRFGFIYLLIYIAPFPLDSLHQLPVVNMAAGPVREWVIEPGNRAWDWAIAWLGGLIFEPDVLGRKMTGSGDTARDWSALLLSAFIAGAGALVWTLIDRRRKRYVWLNRALGVYVRFYLALVMLGYGMVKVIQSQFPAPSLGRLLQPYGDSSPMGLLWTFMGASYGYNLFAGLAEVIPAILLTFRRTAVLGALMATGVMLNIAVLNFCYDVPVKLFSVHLLVMALYVAGPGLSRLFNLLVLGRPAAPIEVRRLIPNKWLDRAWAALRTAIVMLIVYRSYTGVIAAQAMWSIKPDSTPLYGVWDVEEYEANGEARPPLVTDKARWRRIIIERPTIMMVQPMDGPPLYYMVEIATEGQLLVVLTRRPGPDQKRYELKLQQPEEGVFTLEGELLGERIVAKMRRREAEDFLLRTRGFHWVSEYPYNR